MKDLANLISFKLPIGFGDRFIRKILYHHFVKTF